MARDLPREVEFDTLRQALALAVKRLAQLGKEATLDERLYIAFVSVCRDFYLHFFDREGRSQEQLIEDVKRFGDYYDADLQIALEERWRPSPPPRYHQALLRQIADPFFSLYAVCAAVVEPSKAAIRHLTKALETLPEDFQKNHIVPTATVWVQALLDRTAFDPHMNEDMRRRVSEFFRPVPWAEPVNPLEKLLTDKGGLNAAQIKLLRNQLYSALADRDSEQGNAYLRPSELVLRLALDETWLQCVACGLTQHAPFLGHCSSCGSDQLQERPVDHPYMISHMGYFREPLRAVLGGERLVHITAEEHSAQLSQRDVGTVYATTEEFELRFQDIPLGPTKPPVDVLSCTTTMEVGIDIGSLTAVGLRNVPPQRENYQQRSGRSGRRGAAVSTVLTYAQGGPHDNYYYQSPAEIISGEPRRPKVKVNNQRLARRHIHSYLIQTFFHEQLDRLPAEGQRAAEDGSGYLMIAFGLAVDFFAGDGPFSLTAFAAWVDERVIQSPAILATQIASWLPDELCSEKAGNDQARTREKQLLAAVAAKDFVAKLESLKSYYSTAPRLAGDDEDAADTSSSNANADVISISEESSGLLLNVLFDEGLLPSYAFPTDLCSFYVFEADGGRVRIKERPQQAKSIALSEYAPGRLLVINKPTYRVGGIYLEAANTANPGETLCEKPLNLYVYCPVCTYVREGVELKDQEACPVCQTQLKQAELLDPPGFSPERGQSLNERDREQELSYATAAQFPMPVESDQFEWKIGTEQHVRYAYEQNRRLVVVNKGPEEAGFKVCESCGAAWPEADAPLSGSHGRPYLLSSWAKKNYGLSQQCKGSLHQSVYLGHSFSTDLLLLRIGIQSPLAYNPQDAWLHDALRTTAEAMALAASRHLDIDAGELSANYRIMASVGDEAPGALGLADVYLFDTASGGAGYAAEAGENLSEILRKTLEIVNGCPEGCERSCTKCLRHYGNRFWHTRLDRHLASQFLAYAINGSAPLAISVAEQAAQLMPLQRYLELEGWSGVLNTKVAGVEVPLLLAASRTGPNQPIRSIAIGTYPALADSNINSFRHPLHALNGRHDVKVMLLNNYVLMRDLPTAYDQLLKDVGL